MGRKKQVYFKDVCKGLVEHARDKTNISKSDKEFMKNVVQSEATKKKKEAIEFIIKVIEDKRDFTPSMRAWFEEKCKIR